MYNVKIKAEGKEVDFNVKDVETAILIAENILNIYGCGMEFSMEEVENE